MIKGVFFDFWRTLVLFNKEEEVENMRIERAKRLKNELELGVQKLAFALEESQQYKFSDEQVFYALEKVRNELEVIRATINKEFTVPEVIKLILSELGASYETELCNRLSEIYSNSLLAMGIALRGGTTDLLKWLKQRDIKIGIISNTEHGTIEPVILRNFNIAQYFDSMTFSCNVGLRKPASLIFQKALTSLGVKAEESVHIGDQFNADIVGARRCNMKTIYLKTEADFDKESSIEPDAVVKEFSQIPKVLSGL